VHARPRVPSRARELRHNPITGGQDFVLVSEAQGPRIGRQVDARVKQHYAIYDAHGMQAYVEGIGQRLAKANHRPGISYRFVLIDSAEVNAFAPSGGHVYISRGILPHLNAKAELAGIIAEVAKLVTAEANTRIADLAARSPLGRNGEGFCG
jgi:predicted Zn-dependent protease